MSKFRITLVSLLVICAVAAAPTYWNGHKKTATIYRLDLAGVAPTATQVANNNIQLGDVIVDTSNGTQYTITETATPLYVTVLATGGQTVPTGDLTLTAGDVILTAGDVTLTAGSFTDSVGTFGEGLAGTGVTSVTTAAEYRGVVHETVLTFGTVVETFTDGDDEGESTNIYTFPQGRILILGAAIDASVTCSTNFGANPNDLFYVGIGSAAAGDDPTLSETEQDIIAVTTLDTVSNTVWTFAWEADMTAGGDSVYDGTASAQVLYFNTCVADTSISADTTATLTGILRLTWVFLGDD